MEDRDYLRHIRKAIMEVKAHTAGMTQQDYEADSKTQRAVERNLEIVGEATHSLSQALEDAHPGMPFLVPPGRSPWIGGDWSRCGLVPGELASLRYRGYR